MGDLYTVYACGTKKELVAGTPEQAAAAVLQEKGWITVRSVAVVAMRGRERLDFLDCELVGGVLRYRDWNVLP
jgi:hypothetical protein